MSGYFSVSRRLWGSALSFLYHKLMCKPLKPVAVSLALTHQCNSHCIMCNIWKRSHECPDIKNEEMSREEIIHILSNPLFSELVELDLTGGEPHLRDDLVDLVVSVAELKKRHLPKLRSIVVTSNGFLPEKIAGNYRKMLEGLRNSNIDLVSVNSLDGIGQIHEKIRGIRGAYELVVKTLEELHEIRNEHKNFFTGIKTTILPENVDYLNTILDFAVTRNLFHIISPVFFTEGRFRNTVNRKKLELGSLEYRKIAGLYNRPELMTNYFYSQTLDFLISGRKLWNCTAGFNYLFIEFDGKVFPCEMVSESVGDLRNQSPEVLWNSKAFGNWRKGMRKLEWCRTCHEPGAVRYSACTEGLSYLKFLRKLGKMEFGDSFYHEGYCKYLGE